MLGRIVLNIPKNSKYILSRINVQKLGYKLPNGDINFLNKETAVEYAKNKIVQQIKNNNTEYGVLIKDRRIIGEADGTNNSVNIGKMDNLIKRLWNNSNLKRDVDFLHGHPDKYSSGATCPLSCCEGDLETAISAKLKSIVAYNSRGEFNKIEFTENFSKENFHKIIKKFEELLTQKIIAPDDYKKLTEIKKLKDTGNNIPESLHKWFEKFAEKTEMKTKEFLESKEYAAFVHEFYSNYIKDCGLKYSTNFNNLSLIT